MKRENELLEIAQVLEAIAIYAELEHYHGIRRELRESARLLRRYVDSFNRLPVKAIFTQGAKKMPVAGTITGLLPGASDTFFVTPVDTNGNADALPTGSPIPTIVADDPTVTVVTAADGLSASVTAPATTAATSFNLNWAASYTNPAGQVVNITATANVPFLAPPALLPVGGVFSQGSQATASLKTAIKK